ncbi:ABC transporter ATP-binding protein/permease [Aquibium microcysteis]|uniref:ABC transporter ATP-binding protein/permease n=1 Tax=Aquibium microcysteis TaxID=675281 RepID=UPI00165D105B|nr:ABC transporter ATP-binding protein/permease [Aquibium microcysteis]
MEPAGPKGLGAQFAAMWMAMRTSPLRRAILLLYLGITGVIVATAGGQILLNRWNKPFYDSLERRDLDAFLVQLQVFAAIASLLLVLNVAQAWLNQMLHIKLREGLARDLIGAWMKPRRAFRLGHAGEIGVNPDQRMHEDARHLADLTADLSIGLMQATILLASFVGVLWAISTDITFSVAGHAVYIPGYMVWAAIVHAGLGSGLSWLAGRPLVRLNEERYAREAELRSSLMRINEHVDAISLAGGEADGKARLERDLETVLLATRRIMTAAVRLTWVTAGYGWITIVAPLVIASPLYFAGELTFGGLMMAAAAFNQVNGALRWFIDNIGGITDWRATLARIATFRSGVVAMDALHGAEASIRIEEGPGDGLEFENLSVNSSAGHLRLSAATAKVAVGGRLHVVGEPGGGKTLLFHAIAGLWPWGGGTIRLPKGRTVAFVPSHPFIPFATLTGALAYPGMAHPTEAEVGLALDRVGLQRLKGRYAETVRWDRELGDDDRRLLAFARVLLQKPDFIVVDDALDALEESARTRVLDALQSALPDAALVTIGTLASTDARLGPVVRIEFDPQR